MADQPSRDSSLGDADRVQAVREREGWAFVSGDKKSGPFDLESMDELSFDKSVASELGVTVREIFAARLNIPEQRLLPVESQISTVKFTAEAGLGPDVASPGFIMFDGPKWIATESTYFYGRLLETKNEQTKFEETVETESLEPVIVYSHAGRRGVTLARDAVFKLGRRALRPSAKTLGSTGPPTLMSIQSARQFIAGVTVEPAELYELGLRRLKTFSNLDWDSRLYHVALCYGIASYFYDLFQAFPIMILGGAFRAGKTRLLLCITYAGHRGMPILDPREAGIFRTGEAWKPLLSIDEFYDVTKEIERLLRAAYKKGARVPRVEKTKAGVMFLGLFDSFNKVLIASPEIIPANIVDKGITLSLRRMPDPNPEHRDPTPEDFEPFRNMAYIARLTWPPLMKQTANALDSENLGLSGRDLEVWKPVLTVARLQGGEVWKAVLDFAIESTQQKLEESDQELKEILQSLYELVKEKNGDFPISFTPKQIHDRTWERLKDQYRIVKSRQELQGESSERYDYDTYGFETVYKVNIVGQKYLSGQLGLKGKHARGGTVYCLVSGRQFHDIVLRYSPDLPGSERDDYASLVLSSKLLSQSSQLSQDPDLRGKTGGSADDNLKPVTTQVVTDNPRPSGDNRVVTPSRVVTSGLAKIDRENALGDNRDNRDDFLKVSAPQARIAAQPTMTCWDVPLWGATCCRLCGPSSATFNAKPQFQDHFSTHPTSQILGIEERETCEVCGRSNAETITRIGDDTPHYLCSEHLSSCRGAL